MLSTVAMQPGYGSQLPKAERVKTIQSQVTASI